MTKKILLIVGILIIVGIAAWFFLRSQPAGETPTGGFSIRDFLPFGSPDTSTPPASVTTPPANNTDTSTPVNRPITKLRKLSSEPVAGAVTFNTGSTTVVRFIEKGTGNVYEANSDSNQVTRLTNTTIPKIIRAFWLPNGSGFLAQTLVPETEIIETSFIKLTKTSSTSAESLTPFTTVISKLPTSIKEISVRPDSAKIFYYTIDSSVSRWYLSNPDGTGSVLMISHPITEWIPKWISSNLILMGTKSSASALGYIYAFDVTSKSLKRTGISFSGLTFSANKDASSILESSGGSLPQLFSVDSKNLTSTRISYNTLAEKCLWLNKSKILAVVCAVPNQITGGTFPDDWYQGTIATNDSVIYIDVKNDVSDLISSLSDESGQAIDATDLMLSPDEKYLIFRNKIDGYLWMLQISE